MLGGLAAGLGLAWLAHSLGFGEAFANMLLIGLAIMAVLAIVGFVMRRKGAAAAQPAQSPFAFQGAGNAAPQAPVSAPVAPQYNPEKVGNDASARPWEQGAAPAAAAGGSMIGAGLAGAQNWGVPEGFDANGFLEAAKRNFVTLQSAWDRSDINTLRSMMTDEMLGEVKGQLQDREQHREGAQPNQTDVVMLEAQLLGIEDVGNAYMASVEFSGMIREEAHAGPSPFREVWNMTKPKDGTSGWLVAGLQALQ
jgi:predicted lipid-binding transport protein (Tim44 family)